MYFYVRIYVIIQLKTHEIRKAEFKNFFQERKKMIFYEKKSLYKIDILQILYQQM